MTDTETPAAQEVPAARGRGKGARLKRAIRDRAIAVRFSSDELALIDSLVDSTQDMTRGAYIRNCVLILTRAGIKGRQAR